MLRVIQLSCERDERQLFRDLSFSLGTGDALQIVGENGAGKTTLLRAIVGLYSQYTGDIRMDSRPLFIAHKNYLHPDLTVAQNLEFLDSNPADPSYFKITKLLAKKVRQLSQGQLQRVSLTRLLSSPAKLWLIDEPYVHLDLESRESLTRLFEKHLQSEGALLIVSHFDLPFGAKLCLS